MTVGPLHVEHPWWLAMTIVALPLFWLFRAKGEVPGAWARLIEPALLPHLARWLPTLSTGRRAWLSYGLAVMLGCALAGIGIRSGTSSSPPRDLHGRMLVIDTGHTASLSEALFEARTLVTESPGVPTGVIVVAGDAFDVVPLTEDPAQIDRYLRVVDPTMMPSAGRRLDLGLARAMAALTRARITAGQIVLLTGGEAPKDLPTLPTLSDRLWIHTSHGPDPSWQSWAAHLDARQSEFGSHAELNLALTHARDELLRDAMPLERRRGLTPWIIALCLPFWLMLFYQREVA